MRKKLLFPIAIFAVLACGDYYGFLEYLSYFSPDVVETDVRDRRYFYSRDFFYRDDLNDAVEYGYNWDGKSPATDTLNVQAWSEYVKDKIPATLFYAGLYGKESEKLIRTLRDKSFRPAAEYVAHLVKLDQMLYPPRANAWDEPEGIHEDSLRQYIPKLNDALEAAKDPFLQERYVFLLAKLYRTLGEFDWLTALYHTETPKLKTKSFISDWTRSTMAGALIIQGDHEKGIFEFAQIFHTVASRRREADLSIRTRKIGYTPGALRFAKNDQEKANVCALMAIQPFQDGIGLAGETFRYQADHPMLPLIITREINKIEELYFYDLEKMAFYFEKPPYKTVELAQADAKKSSQKLRTLLTKIQQNPKGKLGNFWPLASAYLAYLEGDYPAARQALAAVNASQLSDREDWQQRTITLLLDVEALNPEQPAQTTNVLDQVQYFRNDPDTRSYHVMHYTADRLSQFFIKYPLDEITKPQKKSWFSGCNSDKEVVPQDLRQRSLARSFAAQHLAIPIKEGDQWSYVKRDFYNIYDTTSAEQLTQMLQWVDQEGSPIDQALKSHIQIDRNRLLLETGRKFVLTGDLQTATDHFLAMEPFYLQTEMAKIPFNKKMDPHLPKFATDPLDYIKTMAKDFNTYKEDESDPAAIYTYAAHLWNLSYHGRAWLLARNRWSIMDMYEDPDHVPSSYFTASVVNTLCRKALEQADDPELKAKILYLGAHTEQAHLMYQTFKEYGNKVYNYETFTNDPRYLAMEKNHQFYLQELRKLKKGSPYLDKISDHCSRIAHYLLERQ